MHAPVHVYRQEYITHGVIMDTLACTGVYNGTVHACCAVQYIHARESLKTGNLQLPDSCTHKFMANSGTILVTSISSVWQQSEFSLNFGWNFEFITTFRWYPLTFECQIWEKKIALCGHHWLSSRGVMYSCYHNFQGLLRLPWNPTHKPRESSNITRLRRTSPWA